MQIKMVTMTYFVLDANGGYYNTSVLLPTVDQSRPTLKGQSLHLVLLNKTPTGIWKLETGEKPKLEVFLGLVLTMIFGYNVEKDSITAQVK